MGIPDYGVMIGDLKPCLETVRACRLCAHEMPRAPNPVLQASAAARILVAGQAPGNLADLTGTPFNDPSGVRLRDWMGVSQEAFHDASRVAVVPMGFCFPGSDARGGDLAPGTDVAIGECRGGDPDRGICPEMASRGPDGRFAH